MRTLFSDDRCWQYSELIEDGIRIRELLVFKPTPSGEPRLEPFREVMGPAENFKPEGFVIPSAGRDVSEWNTVGECLDEAEAIHATGGFARNRRVPAATGKQWAEELVQQNDFVRQWAQARSVYGPTGQTQRSRDWLRK